MESDVVDQMVTRWTAERPDLDVSSMHLVVRINLAARLLGRLFERQYGRLGLNSASFDVLATLRQAGKPYRLTPTQLYSASRVSSGTMTNRIDQLERVGLVARIPDPHDRRGLLVELTPRGLEMIDALVAAHAALGQQLVNALPTEERECLVRGLRTLVLTLERVDREGEGAGEQARPVVPARATEGADR